MYCGRLAPSPTGRLHLGHAISFLTAWRRARQAGGRLCLRVEDLDRTRCRPEYVQSMLDDFAWLSLDWDEGPIFQHARRAKYLDAWKRLHDRGLLYPCERSRKELRDIASAPHTEEPLFPIAWRPPEGTGQRATSPTGCNWRFRVPEGMEVEFVDGHHGPQRYIAGQDFGDFLIWRRDDVPAYELAVVVDDADQGITEVVRGEDLLLSTARQRLLFEALGFPCPETFHVPLVRDPEGRRLAKRDGALSLHAWREGGRSFADVLQQARERGFRGLD